MRDVFFGEERAVILQIFEDRNVGAETHFVVVGLGLHLEAGEIGHFRLHRAVKIHVLHKRQIHLFEQLPVVGAKCGCLVRDAGTALGSHEIRRIYFPPVLTILESRVFDVVVKRRRIFFSSEFGSFLCCDDRILLSPEYVLKTILRNNETDNFPDAFVLFFNCYVFDGRSNRESYVTGQGPWCRRPGKHRSFRFVDK